MNKQEADTRPLSPHLTIYRPQNTSILSILHRLTGIGLMIPSVAMVAWVLTIPMGPKYFELMVGFFSTNFGKFLLALSLWGIIYHTLTGIRHLVWDLGRGIDLKWVNLSSWFIIIVSIL
ncbi:MAG: succinate dehydrogenase, cytochrome b556 subunit, partial [Paracoccaceae bacterium]